MTKRPNLGRHRRNCSIRSHNLRGADAVTSNLGAYINASCFAAPAAFSADDSNGLGFGNSGVGIFNGPGQNNFDLSVTKSNYLP